MKRTMYAIILPIIFMSACVVDDLVDPAEPADTNSDDDNELSVTEADTVESLATLENPDAGTRRTHRYKVTWTFKSRDINKCLSLTARGKFKYISRPVVLGKEVGHQWSDQEIIDPTITAVVRNYAGGRCMGSATLTKLTMGQFWTGHECDFNPSLSVSFPWAISFGFWPSCGDRRQAGFSTTYPEGNIYTQHNSGSRVTFADFIAQPNLGQPFKRPCYGVFISAVAFVNSSSDSFGANNSRSRKICLPL